MPTTCDRDKVIANIRRVAGQVNALETMVQSDRDITEILQQVTAANSALKSVARTLLEDYAAGCFSKTKKLDQKELQKVIGQLFKNL